MKKLGDWAWVIGGAAALIAVLTIMVPALFIAVGIAAISGVGSSSASGSSLISGNCQYDSILAKVADGKSQGESVAHGAPQQVPSQFIPYYTQAATDHQLGGCGASILAGIHSIESGFGGDTYSTVNSAGAGGPFQFLQSTWSSESNPPGGCGGTWPSYGVQKGACAAANYLHNSGAPNDWVNAVYSYNHADWYVYAVVLQAKNFSAQTGQAAAPAPAPRRTP